MFAASFPQSDTLGFYTILAPEAIYSDFVLRNRYFDIIPVFGESKQNVGKPGKEIGKDFIDYPFISIPSLDS